jgi:uncharacterized protein
MIEHKEAGTGRRWLPGDVVVLRYLTMRESLPGMSWPCRVVADRDDLVALYVPEGTTFKGWSNVDGTRRLVDTRWRRDMLRLMFPDRGHSIWLTWEGGAERRFTGYYVNMEEPFRRTAIGFDTNDHMLDVVVAPDLTWTWKDVEVMADRVRQGVYSPEFAAEVRAEGERVVQVLAANGSPFCDGWERWTPDPAWEIPLFPSDWDTAPPVVWDRKDWAYTGAR